MKICVTIAEKSLESAIEMARNVLSKSPDVIEIRFDMMDALPKDLEGFKDIRVAKIATVRLARQGGKFSGTDHERLEFFRKAIRSGFNIIDIESDSKILDKLAPIAEEIKIICSTHDFESTPSTSSIIETLIRNSSKADIAKAAFMVNSIRDLHAIFEAADGFRETGNDFVIIGMGELGILTRILSKKLGCAFTYASAEKGREIAPGQLDIDSLRFLGDAPIITGITGYPLSHTISPLLHNTAFKALHIPGIYLRFPAKANELEDFVNLIIDVDIRGINVTIPHKTEIMAFLDKLDESADCTGAVNTIANENGVLTGYNTDLHGVESTFEVNNIDPHGKSALVLGAGGAARACCTFLLRKGAEVYLINRSQERAMQLVDDLGGDINLIRLDDVRRHKFEIIVNCTPLGMKGFPDEDLIDPEIFSKDQFVFDVIYNPPKTRFLSEAEARGAKIASGLEMLISQAEKAFEIWTGRSPPRDVMLKSAMEALK
ncbi:MAG: shikimate dehydrogenase [Methanomassiliicoccales archaeon]